MRKDVTLKMTYAKPRFPEEGGEAYIYLTEAIGRGESKRQVEVPAVGACKEPSFWTSTKTEDSLE